MDILAMYSVSMTEVERGYGQRPDGIVYMLTHDDAKAFIKSQEGANTAVQVPNIYIVCGEPTLVEFKDKKAYMEVKQGIATIGKGYYWVPRPLHG